MYITIYYSYNEISVLYETNYSNQAHGFSLYNNFLQNNVIWVDQMLVIRLEYWDVMINM